MRWFPTTQYFQWRYGRIFHLLPGFSSLAVPCSAFCKKQQSLRWLSWESQDSWCVFSAPTAGMPSCFACLFCCSISAGKPKQLFRYWSEFLPLRLLLNILWWILFPCHSRIWSNPFQSPCSRSLQSSAMTVPWHRSSAHSLKMWLIWPISRICMIPFLPTTSRSLSVPVIRSIWRNTRENF